MSNQSPVNKEEIVNKITDMDFIYLFNKKYYLVYFGRMVEVNKATSDFGQILINRWGIFLSFMDALNTDSAIIVFQEIKELIKGYWSMLTGGYKLLSIKNLIDELDGDDLKFLIKQIDNAERINQIYQSKS